jgi:hypothetical protein
VKRSDEAIDLDRTRAPNRRSLDRSTHGTFTTDFPAGAAAATDEKESYQPRMARIKPFAKSASSAVEWLKKMYARKHHVQTWCYGGRG